MHIEDRGDQVVIEDSAVALVVGRGVGAVIGLGFLFHAIDAWTAYISGADPSLTPVLLASAGVVAAAIFTVFAFTSRSIIVIDRPARTLSVEHRRPQGITVEDIRFDDIADVTVKLAAGGEDYVIDVIRRSGAAVRLTSTINTLDNAREIAAAIDAARASPAP